MLQTYSLAVTPLKIDQVQHYDEAFKGAAPDADEIAAFRIRAYYGNTTFFNVIVPREMVLDTMRLVQPILREVGPLIDQAEVDRQRREADEKEEEVTGDA